MNKKYLDRLEKVIGQARPRLSTIHQLEFKNCFGAVAGYVKGQIFASCGTFGIALKLHSQRIEILMKESGVKYLKYFAKGYIKKDYVVLPERVIEDKGRFTELVNESIRFALRCE